MHLTAADCAESVATCAQRWLWKSKTTFYQSKDWTLPWYFGLLCYSYAVSGLVVLLTHRRRRPSGVERFPRSSYAIFLMFIQAPLSFMADFVNMDQDSIFHVLDRFSALTCAILELWRFYDMLQVTRPFIVVLYAMFSLGGILCFLRSQEAQAIQNRDDFVLFHNLWHIYPLCTSMVVLFDHYLLHFAWHEKTTKKA